jgi:hypothetical protein
MNIFNSCNFSSADWGNVADWAMVVVTVITGVLILKSLQAQNEMRRIELSRYRADTMPVFEVLLRKPTDVKFLEDEFKLAFELTLVMVSGLTAKNFDVVFVEGKRWEDSIERPMVKRTFKKGHDFTFLLKTTGNILKLDSTSTVVASITFHIRFTDDIGTPYSQRISYFRIGNDESTHVSPTEIES